MPMEKLARHGIEMQGSKHHYIARKKKASKNNKKRKKELVLIATSQLQNSLYFLD